MTQEETLVKIPKHLHKMFINAWEGKSRLYAVKAMCYACMGYVREEIRGCTSTACPLYLFRPGYKRTPSRRKKSK